MFLFLFFLLVQKVMGSSAPMILVINKIDCAPNVSKEGLNMKENSFTKHIYTCAVTGQGISGLEAAMLDIIGLNSLPSGGRRWTVNQVPTSYCYFDQVSFLHMHMIFATTVIEFSECLN